MSIPERTLTREMAGDWIRQVLRQEPEGVRLTVSGTCMEPALQEGSRVTLRTCDAAVGPGDVVLLETTAGLRLHRVLLRFRGEVRTKGDRGIYLDPASPLSAIVGVCSTNETRLTRLARVAKSMGRVLLRPRTLAPGGDGARASVAMNSARGLL